MNFDFTDDQENIRKTIQTLCDRYFQSPSDDGRSDFPRDKWEICGKTGLFAIPLAEKDGGLGFGMLTTALAFETFACGCRDEGFVFSCIAHLVTCAIPLSVYGTDEQKQKYLGRLVSGAFIGGSGITEADAGSDFTAGGTTAVKAGDGSFILNGRKMFVTNAPAADVLIVFAKHPGGIRMLDTSAFILEKAAGNYRIGQVLDKMGLRTSTTSEVVIDGVRLPPGRLLGRERLGMTIFNESMLWERVLMSAYHVGAMARQYEEALGYANLRRQYGKKIVSFEGVYNRLIDMKIRLYNSRLMLYKVCCDYDAGDNGMESASMLKLYTSESKVKNSLDALQIFGAYGYVKESSAEIQLRDSMAARIYSGTSEIQRLIIAESLAK